MYFEHLWKTFSALPEVEAIALGGSRASFTSDNNSDYDLYVYCSSVPDKSIRKEILQQDCSYMEIDNQFWETEDDCILKNGIDIDILYRNPEDFSTTLSSVVEHHCAWNGYTTCMWHNLLGCRILFDRNGHLQAMKDRFSVPYPEELRQNIISKNRRLLHGNLPSYDKQICKALLRGDLPSINHRTSAFLESYFDIIFALNRMTHPGEKRMMTYAKEHAKILPSYFEENLQTLFSDLYSYPDRIMPDLEAILVELEKVIDP